MIPYGLLDDNADDFFTMASSSHSAMRPYPIQSNPINLYFRHSRNI